MAVFLQVKLQTFVMEAITSNGDRSRASQRQYRRKMESGIRYHSAVANLLGLSCFLVAASCILLAQYALAVIGREVSYANENFIFYGTAGMAGVALAIGVLLEVAVRAMFCQRNNVDAVTESLRPYPFGGGTVGPDPRGDDV